MKRAYLVTLLFIVFVLVSAAAAAFFLRNKRDVLRSSLEQSSLGTFLIGMYHTIVPYPMDVNLNEVPYSIFSQSSAPNIEDYKARASLPEFKIIKGLDAHDLSALKSVPSPSFKTWERSGADDYSSKYSELDQINKANVKDLGLAWTYNSKEGEWRGNVETNPIIVGGNLYVATPADFLVSINAKTGAENWRTQLRTPARRGLLWWAGNTSHSARLFVPSAQGVLAINPADGAVIRDFGNDGRVGSASSLVPPAVDGDRLIIATMAPSVEAYNVETGAPLWKTSLLDLRPQESMKNFRLAGGNPWGGFALDRSRSRVYVTTGNPAPIMYGANRPGKNDYSCSVVSIDTATGQIKWSFQEVGHDLWDFDIPTSPVLVTLKKDDMPVDAVAVVTKIGNTLLLDRDNGKPIFDFRSRRAPTSTVPGEQTSPYQPDVETPEPFLTPQFSPSDVTDIGESERAHVLAKLRNTQFGFFVPPAINGKVATFAEHGGAEWPGAAVDQKTGILYVPSNREPWILRLLYTERTPNPIRSSDRTGDALYQDKCAVCHGTRREGHYDRETLIAGDTRPIGDTAYPSLIGITASRTIKGTDWFRQAHKFVDLPKEVADGEIEIANQYLSAADRFSDERKSLGVSYHWGLLLDGKGHPGSKPPWGLISAIDLNTGKRIWSVPFGEYPDLTARGVPTTGQTNFGGLIVTKGGLVFATGTIDQKIRAFDASSGAQVWEYSLPAAGTAPPSTYEIDGVQYLVVVATGGIYSGFKDHSDTVMAFKLGGGKTAAQQDQSPRN